ncbi:sulfite exporter TauE/SafE family protein [candidate division WOR-3 bacterium]|nr:sulfite exporter TauE/SafE family protein [candidate division WOR-3 bacterium]
MGFSLIIGAFICEFIDSSLGMLYGTILSPVLIIAGFEPLIVVPSILLSQAVGGLIAAVFHHRFKNVSFLPKSDDSKTVYIITILGIIATIISVFVAVNIPKTALKTYIGVLVFCVGVILLSRHKLNFSWRKILIVGIVSSFNKGLSGGGFGPVVTSGQLVSGREGKSSIGVTTLAEVPICITGFLLYLFIKGIPDWHLVVFLSIGAISAAPLGAFVTSKFRSDKNLRIILGSLVIILGIWTLTKTWLL